MRYVIYGAGGVGSILGGRLFAAGKDAVLICRGAHLTAIQQRGLILRDHDGEQTIPVAAVGHPGELVFTAQDVVILTMQSQDTMQALADLEAVGGGDLPVACCQNGVENEREAARRFARVYGMIVLVPATYLEPGIVNCFAYPQAGVLDVGCFPRGVDALAERIAADITSAGIDSRPDAAVMRLKYTKLLENIGNTLQVMTNVHRSDPRAREVMRRIQDEAAAALAAAGIEWASHDEFDRAVEGRIEHIDLTSSARGGSSTWQALAKGHARLESDYLNGEIVLLGKLHGIPTPYNAALRRLSQQLATAGGRPGQYTIADVEALVAAEGVTAR